MKTTEGGSTAISAERSYGRREELLQDGGAIYCREELLQKEETTARGSSRLSREELIHEGGAIAEGGGSKNCRSYIGSSYSSREERLQEGGAIAEGSNNCRS
jgi:hypothetical protein